jgi:hypothetical protein
LIVLKSIEQLFWGMSSTWICPIFFSFQSSLYNIRNASTKVICPSQRILSVIRRLLCIIGDVSLDHLTKVETYYFSLCNYYIF